MESKKDRRVHRQGTRSNVGNLLVCLVSGSIAAIVGCSGDFEPSASSEQSALSANGGRPTIGSGGTSGAGGVPHGGALAACTSGPNRLCAGEQLNVSQSKQSTNGKYKLAYQSDGNLVLSRVADAKAMWSSGTAGTTPSASKMGTDARLRVIDASNQTRYTTPNPSITLSPPAYLLVSDTGIGYISEGNDLTNPGRWRSGDPECTTGIAHSGACCALSCGTCGGLGCGSRLGGAANCCVGSITNAGVSCGDHQPPCVMP